MKLKQMTYLCEHCEREVSAISFEKREKNPHSFLLFYLAAFLTTN